MKNLVINIPDGCVLTDVKYRNGVLVQVFERDNTSGYIPVQGEIVRVKRKGIYRGVAIIDNSEDKSFVVFVTPKRVHITSRFAVEMTFEKADMDDIFELLRGMKQAGYIWNPVNMNLEKNTIIWEAKE